MLDELKTARKVVGIKQLRKSLKGGQVVRVYLAEDADPRLTDPVRMDCAPWASPSSPSPPWRSLARPVGSRWALLRPGCWPEPVNFGPNGISQIFPG